jgi:hypothetical protein
MIVKTPCTKLTFSAKQPLQNHTKEKFGKARLILLSIQFKMALPNWCN